MRNNRVAALAALGLVVPGFAHATNGMLMEGYGPIAVGLGGAAMAYDNGTAAMANNPATLALMAPGSRIDAMVGYVGPDVSVPSTPGGPLGNSSADAFYMPAFGFVRKTGDLTYGVGIYGQGGMGTEYADGSMAQVGVGRVIFPLAWNVNERLTVGGSVDVVWAGMDLVFKSFGLDFKDDSDFTGPAKGYSLAAKLGFTYKLDDALTIGGVYQSAGNLPKLKGDGYTVEGFDMPAVVGLGFAWQANARLMVAADVKELLWGDSMNTVTMRGGPGAVFVPFQQDWDNQTVVSLGLAYKFTDALTGRVGYNHGKNPIPDANVNFLWPAIVEDHYTVGFGYAFSKQSDVNFAMSYVPEVSVTGTGPQNGGVVIEHSQLNWQLMFTYRF